MKDLEREAEQFASEKAKAVAEARLRVALLLLAGVEAEQAASADDEGRRHLRMRLERLLERERLRGLSRHWSYDLNRHIALKQAIGLLQPEAAARAGCQKENGAIQRRNQIRERRRGRSA